MLDTMASLTEVWGPDFGKRPSKPLTDKGHVQEKRDAVKEGRVAVSPQARTAEAIQRNRKTIDDLSATLPNEDLRHMPMPIPRQESMRETFVQPDSSNPTHDLLLYVATGLFFLYTLDTFVNLGRRLRYRR